jgi:hypothetical protein
MNGFASRRPPIVEFAMQEASLALRLSSAYSTITRPFVPRIQ